MRRTSFITRTASMNRGRMRRRFKSTSYSRRERDFDRMGWIKTLPCCAAEFGPCDGPIEADHAGRRGIGQKATDDTCIPLCRQHHHDRGNFCGVFKFWDQARMRLWLEVKVEYYKALYESVRRARDVMWF